MNGTYRAVKAYHLVGWRGQMNQLAAILLFQGLWAVLTKAQRAALLGHGAKPATLAKLREQQLVDDAGKITLLGEAVLHYRPGAGDDG